MMRDVDGLPLYAFILIILGVAILLIVQGTWLFLDARKREANAWFWGIWGCIQSPLPLIVYWIVVRRKKKKS